MAANVLIIDDEKNLCEILCRMIAGLGHEVKYALTLQEAYALSQSELFDVIYLDVQMPDGKRACGYQQTARNTVSA